MSASPKPRALVGFGDALAAIEAVHSLMAGGYTVVLLARRAGRPPASLIPGVRPCT